MTKLNRLVLGTLAVCLGATLNGFGHGNEKGTAEVAIGGGKVSIAYVRPTLKGRDMLKEIQPGDVWRLGADVSTTMESDVDLDFGGTRVPKGKYILLARLAEPGKWSLIVSSKSAFQFDDAAKVAEVPMELRQETDSVEALTIKVSDQDGRGVIEIAWGTSRLKASFGPAK